MTRTLLVAVFALCALPAHAQEPLWSEISQPGRSRYQLLLVEARRLRDNDLAGAEKKLLEATHLVPNDTAAWIALGEVRRMRRDFPGSHAALEQARAAAPDSSDPDLALHVATARALDGDLEDALEEYRRCEGSTGDPSTRLLTTPPADPSLLPRNEGDVYMALGRLTEAIAAYRRSIAQSSRSAIAHFSLAVALDRDEQLAASHAALEVALAIDSSDLRSLHSGDEYFVPPADRHYYLALAHLARGRLAFARGELRAFLAELPHGPYAARARDRLAAVPDVVDPRELSGTGYDRMALARLLSPRRAELERCLHGDLLTVTLTLTRHEASNPALSMEEQRCAEGVAGAVMKQIPNNVQVLLPLARPEPPPQLPVDP